MKLFLRQDPLQECTTTTEIMLKLMKKVGPPLLIFTQNKDFKDIIFLQKYLKSTWFLKRQQNKADNSNGPTCFE